MYVQDIGGWGTVGNRRENAFKKKRPGEDLVASPFKKIQNTRGYTRPDGMCTVSVPQQSSFKKEKQKKNFASFSYM
jgi:hypothetical protein